MSISRALKDRSSNDVILAMIDKGADVNTPEFENPPLRLAIEHKYSDEVIVALLNQGANPEVDLLFLAIESGCGVSVLTALIDKGLDVNLASTNGTALHRALDCKRDDDVIIALVDKGADVNVPFDEDTPLFYALLFKRSDDVIKTMIDKAVDLNVSSEWTPLCTALYYNRSDDIILSMIDKGADVNAVCIGIHPLLFAFITHHGNKVIFALLAGVDQVHFEIQGFNALHCALLSNYSDEVILALIDKGADVFAVFKNIRIIHFALFMKLSDDVLGPVICDMVDAANGDSFERIVSCAPFVLSNKERNGQVVQALAQKGADVNTELGGRTPLHYAIKFHYSVDMVRLLIDLGADVNTHIGPALDIFHPLQTAIKHKSSAGIVQLLINRGACTKVVDDTNNNLIHQAVLGGSELEVFKSLIKAGVPLNAINAEGKTSLQLAFDRCSHRVDVIELLIKWQVLLHDRECLVEEDLSPEFKSFFARCVEDMSGLKQLHVTDAFTLYDYVVCSHAHADGRDFLADDVMQSFCRSPSVYYNDVLEMIGAKRAFRLQNLNLDCSLYIFGFLTEVDIFNVLLAYWSQQ